MTRQANAIDFWRGFALISIFINHVPGIYYTRFTHANYSMSDSADLFVFLAGWALRYVVGTPGRQQALWYLVLRLGGRALTLYAAQILITMIAIAMLAAAALLSENPLLLDWHNAAAVFQEPIPTHVGLALLMHQLGYFNILPLYVVLMFMAPLFVLIDRYAPHLVVPVSLVIYFATLAFNVAVPTWPVEGEWFFNPLAWQLIFVLGFVLARQDGIGGFARQHIVPIRVIALPIVFCGIFVAYNEWWFDPTRLPNPEAVLPDQQALQYAAPRHSVPGVDRPVLGNLPLHQALCVTAGGLPVDAGAQFAVCVLRRLGAEPGRPDRALPLPG